MKRSVKDFEGLYSITENGEVFTDATGRRKEPQINFGYSNVHLFKRSKCSNKKIHRLVAEAFIPNPENKPEVNHINGIKTDNRVENLEWVTRPENSEHSWRTGLSRAYYGTDTSNAKLDDTQIKTIRDAITEGYKQKDIATYFNVCQSNISKINTKVTWR